MNNQLPTYFIEWRPELPRVCTHYEIRSPLFRLPVIIHKFAEHSLRYCLIKQLNKEKCFILITSKVHTHSMQGYTTNLKIKALMFIILIVIFMLCLPKIKPVTMHVL